MEHYAIRYDDKYVQLTRHAKAPAKNRCQCLYHRSGACLRAPPLMEEARLERTEYGLGPASEGWFVVNVCDAEWETNENGAAACMFESGAVSFPEMGYRLAVLQPGTTVGFYHAESNQEDFLVRGGECVLLIEGEERRLKPWDFVHCPPGTEHVFVGAGDGPCA